MITILFIYNFFYFNLNLFFMLILIVTKLFKIYNNRYYYYHRLLLERYLNNYRFNRIKNINSIKSFYRYKYHYINYQNEKIILKNYFKNK